MDFKNNMLFDVLKNILQEKSMIIFQKHIEVEGFEKQFPRYMVLRYLSMAQESISSFIRQNQIALERFSSNIALYRFLLEKLPRQKTAFIKYLSGKGNN